MRYDLDALRAAAERDGPELEELARLIASEMGESFDCLHRDKAHWTDERGMDCAGRFRDVNEPRQADYLCAADAILASDWLKARDQRVREECAKVAENWTYDPQTGDDIAAAIRGDAK